MAKAKQTRQPNPIFVQFARTGGEVTQYCLDGARTVSALLEMAGDSLHDEDRIRVNGKNADEKTTLRNGNIVTVAGRVSGGQ